MTYRLTSTDAILRVEDEAYIPPDPANRDYAEYLAWVEAGGVADPYEPPPEVKAEPTAQQVIIFDHEDRIRALETKLRR